MTPAHICVCVSVRQKKAAVQCGMQLLFSVMPGEAVQLHRYLGGIYVALPVPLPLKPEWLAMLLPASAAEKALGLDPHGECLNRYLLHVHCALSVFELLICMEQQRVCCWLACMLV